MVEKLVSITLLGLASVLCVNSHKGLGANLPWARGWV